MVDGLVVDAPNWETQTLAAAALGTEGIARMLENWETQTGEGRGEGGRSPIEPTHHLNALLFGKP